MTSQPDMQGLDPKALEAARNALEHAHGYEGHDQCPTCDGRGVVVIDYGEGPGGDVCLQCGGAGVVSPPGHDPLASAITAYLASFPQQTAEPVALRDAAIEVDLWLRGALECKDWLWDGDQRFAAEIARANLAKALAHPASPPVGGAVKVKALRWLDVGTPSELDLIAHTPFDTFHISRDDTCEWPIVLRPFITGQSNYQTVEEAKAAAEAEFERRILSSLASSERSGREAVDRRVVRWQPRGIGSNWNIPDLITGVDDGKLHPDMSGFVLSKAEGELAVDIFGGNAFLDWRPSEPNWIQVKVSAPEPVLAELERLVRANDNLLTPAIVAAAIRNLKRPTP